MIAAELTGEQLVRGRAGWSGTSLFAKSDIYVIYPWCGTGSGGCL